MDSSQLQTRIANIVQHLPPLSEHIDQLFEAIKTTGNNKQRIISLIESDSSLCAEVLHIANSGCYTITHPVETLEEAINIVGIDSIVEDIGIRYANESIRTDFLDLKHLDQYYSHGTEISLACRVLAEAAGLSEHQKNMYAVAGRIHDIGRLVILLASNNLTASLMVNNLDSLLSIPQEEKTMAGMNHCDIGCQICSNWSFAPILCEGVLRHHTPVIKEDVSIPGAVIFLAHFVSVSDFTGKILEKTTALNEMAYGIGLDSAGFEDAKHQYSKLSVK